MPAQFKYKGSLWIEKDGEPILGPGRVELLERIGQTGSIRQAAMQMGMSYRQAWQMIDHMNKHLAAPVLVSQRGGKGGGSATVTPQGLIAIQLFKEFHQRFRQFLEQNDDQINL